MKIFNRILSRCVLLSVSCAALVACASTSNESGADKMAVSIPLPPAEMPPATTVGTEYQWIKNGERHDSKILAVSDGVLSGESSDGCKWKTTDWQFTPTLAWEECDGYTGSRTLKKSKGSPWPMQVGNKWSHSYSSVTSKGTGYSWKYRCNVRNTERVSVPAGEFDAFKIVCKDKWNVRTEWFAPEYAGGSTVRIKYERDSGTTDYELVKFARGG